MGRRQELLLQFKNSVINYPPPGLQDLLKLMMDNPEFRQKKMRYLETNSEEKRFNYTRPVNDNVTWNFLRIQKYFPNVAKICEELGHDFNVFIFCSSFYTPKNSKAFPCHFDPNEIITHQIAGVKYWKIWPQLPESIYDNEMVPPQEGILKEWLSKHSPIDLIVHPGDSCYIEARRPHSVFTTDEDSFSHSFGFCDLNSKFTEFLR